LITMIPAPRSRTSSRFRNSPFLTPDQFQGDVGSLRIQQRLHAISPKSLYSFSDTSGINTPVKGVDSNASRRCHSCYYRIVKEQCRKCSGQNLTTLEPLRQQPSMG